MTQPTSSPYKFSAVALIDVLGFKGIERRLDPSAVTAALGAARQAIANLTGWMSTDDTSHFNTLGGRPNVKSSWFSDTICVVAQLPTPGPMQLELDENDPKVQAALVEVLVRCVAMMIREAAATTKPPLVFRGVITVGDLIVDQAIYMGPAIIEASELYEIATGAFVWLTPKAARLPYWDVEPLGFDGLVWHHVPTKAGTIRTRVVNPFIATVADSPPGREIERGFEEAMKGDRFDIVLKRQHTRRFLRKIIDNDVDLRESDPEALDGLEARLQDMDESGVDSVLFRTPGLGGGGSR
jgi:hypothetical protein